MCLEGMNFKYLSKLTPRYPTEDLFSPELARTHPIRLYELEEEIEYYWINVLLFEESERHLHSYYQESRWTRSQGLNCTSFIYIEVSGLSMNPQNESEFLNRLEQRSGCKWHIGAPTSVLDLGSDQPSRGRDRRWELRGDYRHAVKISGPLSDPSGLEHGLVALRLHNVPLVSNLTLPALVDLSILYYGGVVTEAPVIEGLSIPSILRFVAHYDREVPQFKRMSDACNRMFRWETKVGLRQAQRRYVNPLGTVDFQYTRYFELCHINSIGSVGGTILADSVSFKHKDFKKNSFSFLKRFHQLLLSGVPWYLTKLMDFSSTRGLRLIVTDLAGSSDNVQIKAPKLKTLRIVIKSDDSVLPSFVLPRMYSLGVRISGLNTNISGIWQNADHVLERASFIHITSDMSLIQRQSVSSKNIYTLSDEDYSKIRRLAPLGSWRIERGGVGCGGTVIVG